MKFDNLVKADMRRLISQQFNYGMVMNGVLHPNIKGQTATFAVNSECMTLVYFCQTDDFAGYMEQKISLDWESRQYGDTKVHFICPECGKRSFVLYNSGISFMCRKCTGALMSQRLTDKELTTKIEQKIENGVITDSIWI